MSEYIDKHEAYTLLKDLEAAYIYPPVREAYGTAARHIDQIKPADVQPVKHGRWIEVSPKHSRCSVCDTTCLIAVYPISKGANYCPNCGAKMDLKGGDTITEEDDTHE